MPGRMIHPAGAGAKLHFSPYDRDPQNHINSIGRAALNTTVIEAALRYPNVRIFFNHRCTKVELNGAVAFLETSAGPVSARGDSIIGVDGAFSAVRQSMQKQIVNFQY